MTKSTHDLSSSFLPHVKIRKDRTHTLKHHFKKGSLLYELAGYLDEVADLNPYRLIFAKDSSLISECKKGKWKSESKNGDEKDERPKASFSRRGFYYGIKWFREHRIISERFTITADSLRFPPAFHNRKGFIVASDKMLSQLHDNVCTMYAGKAREFTKEERANLLPPAPKGPGPRPYPGKYRSSSQLVVTTSEPELNIGSTQAEPTLNETVAPSVAPKIDAVAPAVAPTNDSVAPSVAPISSNSCTIGCTNGCTTAADQVAHPEPLTSAADENGIRVGKSLGSVEPLEPYSFNQENQKKQPNEPARAALREQTNTSASFSFQDPMNEKGKSPSHDSERTIGEVLEDWNWDNMDALTDGELNTESKQFQHYEYWEEMEAAVVAAMAEHKDEPFLGRQTQARLMNVAMARVRKEHNIDAPDCWLPVIRVLRAEYSNPVEPSAGFPKQPNGRPIFSSDPNPFVPGDAWEMCLDGIRRCKADREYQGYTVQAADKVWERPSWASGK